MAKRRTIHVLKNNQVNNGALPTSGVQMGEPLVNLYNGILFFSGTTGGNYVQSNSNPGYFEVGSNLYNLELRNQITKYQNISGAGLVGKFLSGTTTGFVLADISMIAGTVDSYTTGATWTPNTLTITLNQSKPPVPVVIDSFIGLNLFGTTTATNLVVTGTTSLQQVTATNINATNVYVSSNITGNTATITTINSTTSNSVTSNINNLFVTGTEIVNNLTITGTGIYNTVAVGNNPLEIVNFSSLSGYVESNDTYVTGGTVSIPASNGSKTVTIGLTYKNGDGTSRTLTAENTFTTGGTYNNSVKNITFTKNDSTQYTVDLAAIDVNDTYVTGGTNNAATNATSSATIGLKYNQDVPDGTYSLPYTDAYTTGGTLASNILHFTRNDGVSYTIDLNSLAPTGTTALDKYVTGFTYNNNNIISLTQSAGGPSFSVDISILSGVTASSLAVSNLTPGQVVYVGSANQLKTDAVGEFAYNDSTNVLTLGTTSGNLVVNNGISDGAARFGQGGLIIGAGGTFGTPGIGNLVVHGNFTVFGTGTTVATNELYVEDPQITLNYNPSGSTAITSIASGFRIQDGSGLNVTASATTTADVFLTITQMNTLTGLTFTEIPSVSEYTGPVGYENRGWLTQLNDIVIRNTNFNNGAPNGVRVLAEFDILDGGVY